MCIGVCNAVLHFWSGKLKKLFLLQIPGAASPSRVTRPIIVAKVSSYKIPKDFPNKALTLSSLSSFIGLGMSVFIV